MRRRLRALPLAVCGLLLSGCGQDGVPGAPTVTGSNIAIAGAGSTAQSAGMKGWIAGYTGGLVDYDPVGSSGGRSQFISGGVAFAGSDAAMKDAELQQAQDRCDGEVLDIPLYISPIAVIYHLDGVESLQLSAPTIARIFTQSITRWNDPAIAADNPGLKLPSTRITPVNRADGSGTTSNFTDYLAKAAPEQWRYGPQSDWPVKGGEQGNGNSGVVAAVYEAEGGIGYADEGQAEAVSIAKILVGNTYVAPTAEGASALVNAAPVKKGRSPNDLALDISRTSTTGYPIVLVTYTVACADYPDDRVGAAVRGFLTYAASDAGQSSAQQAARSAPLSPQLAAKVAAVVQTIA